MQCAEHPGHGNPLMIAIQNDDESVLELMLDMRIPLDRKCDLQLRDNKGFTALHHAAMQGSLTVVKQLLDLGADPLAQTQRGWLPVDVVHVPLFRVCEQEQYANNFMGWTGGAGAWKEVYWQSDAHRRLQKETGVEKFLRSFMYAAQLVETEGYSSILNGISVVAVLIVTVTFLGLQTPPGGPSDGDGGLVKLPQGTFVDMHEQSGHAVMVKPRALRVYFVLDGLSLFLAASDLLLVLTFLLPGIVTTFRKGFQAAWVWCMLVSCTVLLALALLCAVGAYVAAGCAVMPPAEYGIMYSVVGAGGAVLLLALAFLIGFIVSVKPVNTLEFVGTLPLIRPLTGHGKHR